MKRFLAFPEMAQAHRCFSSIGDASAPPLELKQEVAEVAILPKPLHE
jgi:hypothetical protein